MADLACWYKTQLPSDILNTFNKDVNSRDTASILNRSTVVDEEKVSNRNIRKSKNFWISTNHWIGGWIWFYIQKLNRENFKYDIIDIDGDQIQYTHYDTGDYYHWHSDTELSVYQADMKSIRSTDESGIVNTNIEYVRKLSFTLQLSSPDDYTGGELQFLDFSNESFFAPKDQGSIIVFDSRIRHRVRKVKSGARKSLVGWVVGPRWR